MQIIGEKINGTRPEVARSIAARDEGEIQTLAIRQADAGAHWLDINAGTLPDREADDLIWLVETVQRVVDIPLCLDSANPQALAQALGAVRQTPMINSISGEAKRLQAVLPLVSSCGCPVIALLLDNQGIPRSAAARVAVAGRILQSTRSAGIADEQVYFDPITLTVGTEVSGAQVALETMQAVRREFPKAKLSVGLSNVSFGLPGRSHINRAYLTLALSYGLDAALLDPLDRELRITMLAAQAVLGHDKFGVNYIRSQRADALA